MMAYRETHYPLLIKILPNGEPHYIYSPGELPEKVEYTILERRVEFLILFFKNKELPSIIPAKNFIGRNETVESISVSSVKKAFSVFLNRIFDLKKEINKQALTIVTLRRRIEELEKNASSN